MKTTKILSIVAIAVVAVALMAFIGAGLLSKTNTENKGFAVIELFTSEGCFSCPPADALVAKIEKESGDKPVYILAYHVDYWNSPAWKDQFSSADFSKRQRAYAKTLKVQSVYTPQIVVNGQTEFVGSEERTLRNAIGNALKNTRESSLGLTVTKIDAKEATLKYTIGGGYKHSILQVAVVQKTATSKVGGGENGGRMLSHVQIVRRLQQINLLENIGMANVALPEGFDTKSGEIIGFLQSDSNGAITGAAKASFVSNDTATAVKTSTK